MDKKSIVLYASVHHGNTKKVVDAMQECQKSDLIDVTKAKDIDISGYDIIIIASGVYFSKPHKSIIEAVNKFHFSDNQKVFLVITTGSNPESTGKKMKEFFEKLNIKIDDVFACKGFDTYGPFKLIGGIAKGCPTEKDLENAKSFMVNIIE